MILVCNTTRDTKGENHIPLDDINVEDLRVDLNTISMADYVFIVDMDTYRFKLMKEREIISDGKPIPCKQLPTYIKRAACGTCI